MASLHHIRSKCKRYHTLIEQYTPTSNIGRFLFSTVSGSIGAFSFYIFLVSVISHTYFWILTAPIGLVAGLLAITLSIVTLWPVYLSLIDNIDSPESYSKNTTATILEKTEVDNSIELLKTRYAKGEISEDKFEQKVEHLLDIDSIPRSLWENKDSKSTNENTIREKE